MAIRIVEESDRVKTAEDAERYVYFDSGCAVLPTGRTRKIVGGFEVECFSTDGRPRSMDRPDRRLPASSLPDLPAIEDVPDSPGWQPYSNPQKPAGQE